MSFTFNGTTLTTQNTGVVFNGVNLTVVYMNGVLVWQRQAPPGSQDFTSNGYFTVPEGYYTVSICMCGGGGGGSTTDDRSAGGGWAGNGASQNLAVTPGQVLRIVVGTGGAGAGQGAYTLGSPGGTSYIIDNASNNTLVATGGGAAGTLGGGVGGNPADVTYSGNGGVRTTCGGSYYDGIQSWNTGRYMGGGQAGYFGNGTDGGTNTDASAGSGAGGGGSSKHVAGGAGSGGSGRVRIAWA